MHWEKSLPISDIKSPSWSPTRSNMCPQPSILKPHVLVLFGSAHDRTVVNDFVGFETGVPAEKFAPTQQKINAFRPLQGPFCTTKIKPSSLTLKRTSQAMPTTSKVGLSKRLGCSSTPSGQGSLNMAWVHLSSTTMSSLNRTCGPLLRSPITGF